MIKDSLTFEYNGIDSSVYKLINVNYNVGLFEEDFLPEQELFAEQIPGRDDLYLLGSKTMPLQIDLTFAFEEGFEENIKNVSRWLFQDYYKPLIFSDMPHKIYHCMYIGDTNLLHTSKEGLIEISMRNIDSYARSQFQSMSFQSVNDVTINNLGDTELLPIIELDILENMDIFTIVNKTNGTALKFENLLAGDKLEVDLYYKIINNNVGFRYDNLTLNTFLLETGVNNLYISKKEGWKVKMRYQYRYL